MATPRWLDEREAHLWRAWLRVAHELPRALEDEINQGSGLSAADYAILIPLSESADGVLRPRDIGREIWWDRSRLSHQLTRMEKRGLVAREECAEDGRGALVRMTPAGRAAIEGAAPDHVAATRRYFFDHLSSRDVDVLTACSIGSSPTSIERAAPTTATRKGLARRWATAPGAKPIGRSARREDGPRRGQRPNGCEPTLPVDEP